MPGDPEECRQHALRCAELADRAEDPEMKARFRSLAESWEKLANEVETTLTFAYALEEPPNDGAEPKEA